jgi:hypothetical protein
MIRRACCAAALLLIPALCCQTDAEEGQEPAYPPLFDRSWSHVAPAPNDLGVALSFPVGVRTDALDVAYSLKNKSDKSVYVIGRPAPEWDGGERAVQIDFYRGDLMLSRLLLPQPETMKDCHGDHTPDSVLLAPGAVTTDQFQVPLPARVNISMTQDWLRDRRPITPTRSRWTDHVRLTLGILVERGDVTEEVTLARTLALPRPIEILDDDEEPQP